MKNNDLFGTDEFPSELSMYITSFDIQKIERGMRALNYQPGTPGWKAVHEPITPIDKAFQIYTLLMLHHYNFGHETYEQDKIWTVRDDCWRKAAEWLARTQSPFQQYEKKQTRELMKTLPDAIRVQCSFELPAGKESDFPKDTSKKSKAIDECTDILQTLGWNRKIRQQQLALGEIESTNKPLPKSMGSLHDMQIQQMSYNNNSSEQLSLL